MASYRAIHSVADISSRSSSITRGAATWSGCFPRIDEILAFAAIDEARDPIACALEKFAAPGLTRDEEDVGRFRQQWLACRSFRTSDQVIALTADVVSHVTRQPISAYIAVEDGNRDLDRRRIRGNHVHMNKGQAPPW